MSKRSSSSSFCGCSSVLELLDSVSKMLFASEGLTSEEDTSSIDIRSVRKKRRGEEKNRERKGGEGGKKETGK